MDSSGGHNGHSVQRESVTGHIICHYTLQSVTSVTLVTLKAEPAQLGIVLQPDCDLNRKVNNTTFSSSLTLLLHAYVSYPVEESWRTLVVRFSTCAVQRFNF